MYAKNKAHLEAHTFKLVYQKKKPSPNLDHKLPIVVTCQFYILAIVVASCIVRFKMQKNYFAKIMKIANKIETSISKTC